MSDLVHVKGLKELAAMLQSLPSKLEANVLRSALRSGANVVKDEAVRMAPAKSGLLRAGLKVSTSNRRGTVTAKVKATGKHAFIAPWIEYGVAAHKISGKKGGWLSFGGLFAKSVQHPGFAPKPFMRPALDSKAQAAVIAVGNAIKKRLSTKEGLNTSDINIEAEE